MYRLLWAEAIDNRHTALVLETPGGEMLGGVATLSSFNITFRGNFYDIHGGSALEMRFFMEWFRIVKSPEDFWQSREYVQARQKKLPEPAKAQIAPPLKMIENQGDPDG